MIVPDIFLCAVVVFSVSFLIHVLLWRKKAPSRQIFSLALIFIFLPLAAHFFIFLGRFLWPQECFFSWLLNILLSLSYMMTYPAIHMCSPTLKIISQVRRAMPGGLSFCEIKSFFPDGLSAYCFDGLIRDGFIYPKGEKYFLSVFGRLVASCFVFYRKALRLPLGGG